MKKLKNLMPNGLSCILILLILFGYMSSVMGLTNMLNTIMNTAHDLLLNTVFYLMGMCVVTGALGKVLVEFGVVDMLQRMLRPIMKPLFNMPGVASLGAVLTFLSDNPAIIALSQNKGFARYFKKYQHVSLVNFGTAFGMGLLVIVFMIGQGYFMAPFVGFFGAICGCVISTRLMQYFTCKDFPSYKTEDAITLTAEEEQYELALEENKQTRQDSTFVHVLNALLDGGKSGVEIGLAIIPGVLIISTLVMMLTFGGSTEGVDASGNDIIVYTGSAYQGTQLLPWLAGKISFLFEWLFGFTAPELVAFPITALGAVGAALGLIPEFAAKGLIDGNAIAVCTAMGMCWSGYLSTDAATLDSLGYRPLVPRAFLSTFVGGICAGIITHWTFVGITAIVTMFAPKPIWSSPAEAWNCNNSHSIQVELIAMDDGSYTLKDWAGKKGVDLQFTVAADSTIQILNSYADKNNEYFFVKINPEAKHGEYAYAALYPIGDFSKFVGNKEKGSLYVFSFIYDEDKHYLNRGYYEVIWGGQQRRTYDAEAVIERVKAAEHAKATLVADSLQRAVLVDSLIQTGTFIEVIEGEEKLIK